MTESIFGKPTNPEFQKLMRQVKYNGDTLIVSAEFANQAGQPVWIDHKDGSHYETPIFSMRFYFLGQEAPIGALSVSGEPFHWIQIPGRHPHNLVDEVWQEWVKKRQFSGVESLRHQRILALYASEAEQGTHYSDKRYRSFPLDSLSRMVVTEPIPGDPLMTFTLTTKRSKADIQATKKYGSQRF